MSRRTFFAQDCFSVIPLIPGQQKVKIMKIYVGNLSYRTTNDELRNAFEQYGTVNSADIIMDRETGRSKGFGFVEMPQDEEAHQAIENLDNTEIGQRPIKVNEARAREPRPNTGRRFGGQDRGPRRY